MYVNHSGWTKDHGAFSYDIFLDEKRQDYELTFGDGTIARQETPFEHYTYDWNHDGDVYTQFGAWFSSPGQSGSTFWTPENMVFAAVEAQCRTRPSYSSEVVSVKGIQIPPPHKRPSLTETIHRTEQRAMHQEADRNRRMNALGIRPPGEPWAR